MARLVFAGVAWLAALGLFAALIDYSARPRPTPTPPAVTDLVRALNKMKTPSPFMKHEAWVVTRATSAQKAIVIDVEADQPENAQSIAVDIVKPLQQKYEEILVYVRPIGSPAQSSVRRVQWTPHGGFVETTY
jgi:hypothetical protein